MIGAIGSRGAGEGDVEWYLVRLAEILERMDHHQDLHGSPVLSMTTIVGMLFYKLLK